MMTVCDPYYDPCRVTAWAERERPPRDREMWGEAEGITPSGEKEGVWGHEEAGTELDQRPARPCKYTELTSNTRH